MIGSYGGRPASVPPAARAKSGVIDSDRRSDLPADSVYPMISGWHGHDRDLMVTPAIRVSFHQARLARVGPASTSGQTRD